MSLVYLGSAYRRGIFGRVDLVEAEKSYARAADYGSVIGTYLLGRLHYDRQNYHGALGEFGVAASKDFAPALHSLARLYWLGLGTTKDIRVSKSTKTSG